MELHLYETYQKIEGSHWWFAGRRAIIRDLLKKYVPVKTNARIFDFGCNTGNLASLLQKGGYDVYGSDISEEAIAFGKRNSVKNIEAGEIGRMPFADMKFDIILSLDVIEHIDDHVLAMRTLRGMLAPGGRIIIMVPALPILWGLQDEVAHHFRRYTKKSFRDLAEKAGLKITRLTYFNFLLFPMIAGVRLMQRLLKPFIKPKRGSDFELNNPFVNEVLKSVFVFECKLLRFTNFPIGVSLLAVLEAK